MTKTTINCSFKDAVGNPLSGYILVGVDSWIMKDDNADTISNLTSQVNFTAGACTLLLEPSDTIFVTYNFEVWYYKSVTTSDPDTGAPIVSIVNTPLVPKFYAQVPTSTTPLNFNQLSKQTGINRDNIDTALSAIVRRLYNEDTFWSRLQANIFKARGVYSNTLFYSRGDVVTYDGGSYIYYNDDRTQGTLPTNTAYWQKLADRGFTGAGTTGNDATFGPSWDGQTDAPSRNAVYDALQLFALASTVSGFAPLASPVLTGTPTAPTPISTDNSTKLATTAFVQGLIATVTKAIVPVGIVSPFAAGSAPTGWVLCDGRTLNRTTYSALFAVLGTTYNTGGELSTEFRVPDLRGRSIFAPDAMGGVAASRIASLALAGVGGTATETLTIAQIPSHFHSLSLAGFTATGLASSAGSGYGAIAYGATAPNAFGNGNRTSASDSLGAINLSGSGGSHNNLPPYISLNYIIYTGV